MTENNNITIATVFWQGSFKGRDYTEQDVWNLYNSIHKHYKDFNFICLTNRMASNLPGEKIELKHNWPGWWSKIELFREDISKPLLFIDLDSVVVRSLDKLITPYTTEDIVLLSAKRKNLNKGKVPEEGRVYKYRTGTMLINKNFNWVYEAFKAAAGKYMLEFRGDEDILGEWMNGVSTYNQETIIKTQSVIKNNKLPKQAVIVTGGTKIGSFRNMPKWLKHKAYD